MMKINLLLSVVLITLISPVPASGQASTSVIDHLSVPGPIVFEGKSYNLIWTSHPANNLFKQEYIQSGDTVTKFQTMILLDFVPGKVKIDDLVKTKIDELKRIKETNPVVNFEVFENNGEYILDFLLSENSPDGNMVNLVERNVYRYKAFTAKSGHEGVLLFGVSTRSYGDSIDGFFIDLKSNREALIEQVGNYAIPEITIRE